MLKATNKSRKPSPISKRKRTNGQINRFQELKSKKQLLQPSVNEEPKTKLSRSEASCPEDLQKVELVKLSSECINQNCTTRHDKFTLCRNSGNAILCRHFLSSTCRIRQGKIGRRERYYTCPMQPICNIDVCYECYAIIEEVSSPETKTRILRSIKWMKDTTWDISIIFRFEESGNQAKALQEALVKKNLRTICLDYSLVSLYGKEEATASIKNSCLVILLGSKSFGTNEELRMLDAIEKPFFLIKMCLKFISLQARRKLPDRLSHLRWRLNEEVSENMIDKVIKRLRSISDRRASDKHDRLNLLCGSDYIGQNKNGIPHGKGKIRYPDGSIFEGEFVRGVREGFGTFIYGLSSLFAGDAYIGAYHNDLRHGVGVYFYGKRNKKCGYSYKGEWKDGIRIKADLLRENSFYTRYDGCLICKNKLKTTDFICKFPHIEEHGFHLSCFTIKDSFDRHGWFCDQHDQGALETEQVLEHTYNGTTNKKNVYEITNKSDVKRHGIKDIVNHPLNNNDLHSKNCSKSTKKRSGGIKAHNEPDNTNTSVKEPETEPLHTSELKVEKDKQKRENDEIEQKRTKLAEANFIDTHEKQEDAKRGSEAEYRLRIRKESKVDEGFSKEDAISLETVSDEEIERCPFPCLREGCDRELKSYVMQKCRQRGVVCDLRENPVCENRGGRISIGMYVFTCPEKNLCDIDICFDCYPFEAKNEEQNSHEIIYCLNESCNESLKDFERKICNERGVQCDLRISDDCSKRFGKITLSSTFFSCPRFPECSVDICQKCFEQLSFDKNTEGYANRKLRSSFYWSKELSSRLRENKQASYAHNAIKSWPPREAYSAMSQLSRKKSRRVKHAQEVAERRDLCNVISSLKYK